jgi:hypothetical protein
MEPTHCNVSGGISIALYLARLAGAEFTPTVLCRELMLVLAFSRVDVRIGFFGGNLAMKNCPSGWRNSLSKRHILARLFFVGRSTHVCCLYIELREKLIFVEAFFL